MRSRRFDSLEIADANFSQKLTSYSIEENSAYRNNIVNLAITLWLSYNCKEEIDTIGEIAATSSGRDSLAKSQQNCNGECASGS